MMYCQYCKSKIFEEDRVCNRCGAPTKDFIEEAEEVDGYNIAPESNASIHSIAVIPSILFVSKSWQQQLQVYGIRGGASHNAIVTSACNYNISGDKDNCFTINHVGLVNTTKDAKVGSRAKAIVSYTNDQNEVLLDECILQVG
jgi:hypothetical protein